MHEGSVAAAGGFTGWLTRCAAQRMCDAQGNTRKNYNGALPSPGNAEPQLGSGHYEPSYITAVPEQWTMER